LSPLHLDTEDAESKTTDFTDRHQEKGPMPRKPKSHPLHNSVDRAKLKELVSRIEEAENDKLAIAEDLRGLYQEARLAGFHAQALRQVVKMRREDKDERDARQALIDEYMQALQGLADLPLGRAAMVRDGLMPPV
jgi:uncharacterized protein (UPF0335 family)